MSESTSGFTEFGLKFTCDARGHGVAFIPGTELRVVVYQSSREQSQYTAWFWGVELEDVALESGSAYKRDGVDGAVWCAAKWLLNFSGSIINGIRFHE